MQNMCSQFLFCFSIKASYSRFLAKNTSIGSSHKPTVFMLHNYVLTVVNSNKVNSVVTMLLGFVVRWRTPYEKSKAVVCIIVI